jgi:hypothetical protein
MKKTVTLSKIHRFHKQAGASLLEIISYLGIASVVILGAVMLLNSAFGGANANRALNEVTSIQMNVKKLFMGQQAGFGTGSLNTTIATAQKFPTTLRVAGANVFNAWNSAVVVTGANNQFTISYAGVPQDVCIDLISGSAGFESVAVNGAAAMATPITPAQAAGATGCNAATNTIVWRSN